MRAKREQVEVKRLADETDMDFMLKHIVSEAQWNELESFPMHRDDCWLFILLEAGAGEMEIDFHKITMSGRGLCAVRPGQVHYRIGGECPSCWVVKVDASQMDYEYVVALDETLSNRQDFLISNSQLDEMSIILHQISRHQKDNDSSRIRRKLISSLLNVFICQVIAVVSSSLENDGRKSNRQHEICYRFRKLLSENNGKVRTPSQCAEALSLSPSYLNEVVKHNTGFTVSYWLRDNILTEAKRQLCFTENSVKEIAYHIGYDDHIYFSKVFRQHVGLTPGEFRRKYRK